MSLREIFGSFWARCNRANAPLPPLERSPAYLDQMNYAAALRVRKQQVEELHSRKRNLLHFEKLGFGQNSYKEQLLLPPIFLRLSNSKMQSHGLTQMRALQFDSKPFLIPFMLSICILEII